MENAVLRGRPDHPLVIGDAVLIGPHSHLNGARVDDEVFLATGTSVFAGAVAGARSELRINSVLHVNSVLAPDTVVPIGWIAAGDPAQLFPPDQHVALWRRSAATGLPGHHVWRTAGHIDAGHHAADRAPYTDRTPIRSTPDGAGPLRKAASYLEDVDKFVEPGKVLAVAGHDRQVVGQSNRGDEQVSDAGDEGFDRACAPPHRPDRRLAQPRSRKATGRRPPLFAASGPAVGRVQPDLRWRPALPQARRGSAYKSRPAQEVRRPQGRRGPPPPTCQGGPPRGGQPRGVMSWSMPTSRSSRRRSQSTRGA